MASGATLWPAQRCLPWWHKAADRRCPRI